MKRFLFVGLVILFVLVLTAGAVPAQVQKNPGHRPPHKGASAATITSLTTRLGYKLVPMLDGLDDPAAIAVSTPGDTVYFGQDDSYIYRLRNGSVASAPATYGDVDVCRLRGALYAGDDDGGIYKLGLDGNWQFLTWTPLPFDVYVSGLDVDLATGTIYYVVNDWEFSEFSALYKLPAGSDTPIMLDYWYDEPSWGLAVKGNYLYISDYYDDSIWSYSKKYGDWDEIIFGLDGPTDIGFDKKGNMYVAEYDGGSIARIQPGSTKIVRIASGLGEPFYLQLDASDRIYFTDFDWGMIWKLFKQ